MIFSLRKVRRSFRKLSQKLYHKNYEKRVMRQMIKAMKLTRNQKRVARQKKPPAHMA